jgi:putative transposase
LSGKPHLFQGWDESEPVPLYVSSAYTIMPKGYTSSNTSVHFMNYHFVWCPKYRRKVITTDIELRLQEIIKDITRENGWEIIALETMPDHVHLFIKTDPTIAPNNVIAMIKGRSSRILRNEFPWLRKRLPTLWTRSYFVSTHGHVSSETIKKYVEDQKGI